MKTRKLFAMILALCMLAAVLAGCGPADRPGLNTGDDTQSGTQTETKADGTKYHKLTVGSVNAAQNLSPVTSNWSAEYHIATMMYETLGSYDENLNLVGICAKSWKQLDEEGYEYEIEIYDYIEDIDGNHITADDIVACFQNAVDEKYMLVIRYLDSFEKTGDYTVKVRLLNNAVDSFPGILNLRVYSQKAYNESPDKFATRPVGTTSYRVTDFEPGGSVTLKKVEKEHWQKPELRKLEQQSTIDEVVLVPYTEASQQSIAVETGDIDLMFQMSASVVNRFLNDPAYENFNLDKVMSRGLYFSGEAGHPTADNKLLRQAISYAIDKQGIVDVILSGYGTPEKSFTSHQTIGYNQKWLDEDFYDYNPEKAKELLAQAGYKPGELSLTILTLANDEWQKCAQIVQGYLIDIGIDAKIEAYEGALFGTLFNDGNNFDITIDQIGGNFYISNVNSKMGQAGYGGKSKAGFVDDELEALIQKCRYADATPEDFDNLHYYLKEQAYTVPLYDTVDLNIARVDSGIKEIKHDFKLMYILNATVFDD